jgi:hypothetical protein
MTLEFELNEQDFLDFQLFTASQSKKIAKKKMRGLILWTPLFAVLSVFYYFDYNDFMAISFGVLAIVYALFYSKLFVWQYKRYYKTYVKENFSHRFGEKAYFEINNQTIKDKTGDETINVSEIEKVDETEKHFFVEIKSGVSLIIPKDRIQNSDEVRAKFETLGFNVNKVICKWK